MASGAKSFVLNRESDFKHNSIIKNINFKDDVMVSQTKDGKNGVYISQSFDSKEKETVWHRFRMKAEIPENVFVRMRFYASDKKEILVPHVGGKSQKEVNLDEYLRDEGIDIGRKVDVFDDLGAKYAENAGDILLYDLKGRYLWVCFEILNYESQIVKIHEIKIEFPKNSFSTYLPEIYREYNNSNSFTERFLGIFQSIYVDLEDKIDYTSSNFDVDIAPKPFLDWIASWLSVKNANLWGEKKLRKLTKEAIKLHKMKGTKESISKIVEEYTGKKPIIIEQFDVKNNMYYNKQRSTIENLFGDNGFVFTVILNEEDVPDPETYVELLRIINSVKPADAICSLVVLENQIFLDHHCYTGINSYISKSEALSLTDKEENNDLVLH